MFRAIWAMYERKRQKKKKKKRKKSEFNAGRRDIARRPSMLNALRNTRKKKEKKNTIMSSLFSPGTIHRLSYFHEPAVIGGRLSRGTQEKRKRKGGGKGKKKGAAVWWGGVGNAQKEKKLKAARLQISAAICCSWPRKKRKGEKEGKKEGKRGPGIT